MTSKNVVPTCSSLGLPLLVTSVKFGISQVWGEATLPNTWLPPYQLAVLECKTSAQNHCTSRLPRPCHGGCVAGLNRAGWMKVVITRDAISIQFYRHCSFQPGGMDPRNSLMFSGSAPQNANMTWRSATRVPQKELN